MAEVDWYPKLITVGLEIVVNLCPMNVVQLCNRLDFQDDLIKANEVWDISLN
jgi:hypothetical protein